MTASTTPADAGSGLVLVTPGGHLPQVWQARLAEADHVDLPTVLATLGVPVGSALLVCGAHPDDEVLGLGRMISMWSRQIGPVTAAVATAGEACLDHVGRRPEGLAGRRLAEWNAALDDLGVGDRRCLGLSDGRVAEQHDALESALRVLVDDVARHTDQVVIATPWRHDPHPDHRACGRAATKIGRERWIPVVEFPVWTTYWGDPDSDEIGGVRIVEVSHDQAAERAHRTAVQRFVSQLAPLARHLTPVVPEAMLAHHRAQLLFLGREATS